MLRAIWLVVRADGKTDEAESIYLKQIIDNLSENDETIPAIECFSKEINMDDETVLKNISLMKNNNKAEIYKMACIASVVDRKLSKQEEEMLKKLAFACDQEYKKSEIIELSKKFK